MTFDEWWNNRSTREQARMSKAECFGAYLAGANDMRERCAKIVEDTDVETREYCMNVFEDGHGALFNAAAAIRALETK